MKTIHLTKGHLQAANNAHAGLMEMCDWADTKEGGEYWADISRRVARIRNNIEKVVTQTIPEKL